MHKANHEMATGNDRFEGFCVDVLERLALALGLSYSLALAPDGKPGRQGPDGGWDGMVLELVSGVGTFASCR